MAGISGNIIAQVEQRRMLFTESITDTTFALPLVPTGTIIAVCGFVYKSDLAIKSMVIEDGAGVNQWALTSRLVGEVMELEFDHPLLMDGLGVVFSGTTIKRWSLTFARLSG